VPSCFMQAVLNHQKIEGFASLAKPSRSFCRWECMLACPSFPHDQYSSQGGNDAGFEILNLAMKADHPFSHEHPCC